MTENEAHEKWCPMVQVVPYSRGGSLLMISNRGDYCDFEDWNEEEHNCIASACGFWRWNGYSDTNGSAKTGYCGMGRK